MSDHDSDTNEKTRSSRRHVRQDSVASSAGGDDEPDDRRSRGLRRDISGDERDESDSHSDSGGGGGGGGRGGADGSDHERETEHGDGGLCMQRNEQN